jgi:integrase
MPQLSSDSIHILEGKATLYKRENTPHWQVRYKVLNRWLRQTTKCEELKDAKNIAVEIVTNAWFRERNDLPIVSKRFKSVAKLAIHRMQALAEAGQGKAVFETYINALEKYHVPFLGNHNIDRIDNTVMQHFAKWRIEQMRRVPKASTLNNHNSALNRVFDEAVERGYMKRDQVPLLKAESIKKSKRSDFTLDEYTALYRGMRSWVREGRKGNETLMRQILREYVLVLANTGIRAGTESMNLKWHHVKFITHAGQQYLTLNVNGKTGAREVICRHRVATYLDRLRKVTTDFNTGTFEDFLKMNLDLPVFNIGQKDMTTALGKVFQRLLTKLELLIDTRTDTHRTLYSLRHTYATLSLTTGRMDVYKLAKHMGTSVAMIEQYYGHVQLRNIAAQIASD